MVITNEKTTLKVKFNLGDEKEYNSLAARYDGLPFLHMFEFDSLKLFYEACD
jgi:hypothetical protein